MPTRKPLSSSANDATVPAGSYDTGLHLRGSVPSALSGMFFQHLGPDRIDAERTPMDRTARETMVHALELRAGRAFYVNRWVIGNAAAATIVSFGGSVLAIGAGTLAHELPIDCDTPRRIDLAGAGRTLVAHGHLDPGTGELHLLTDGIVPAQLHVTVSRGGLTRAVRSIHDAPSHIGQFDITSDHVVLLADGFVGLMGRAHVDSRPTWFAIDTVGRTLGHAHAHGDSVSVYVDGPSLERWTLERRAGTVRRHVLDAMPQTLVRGTLSPIDVSHRFLWTVGAGGVHKHDVRAGGRESHDLGLSRHAGEPVFVADPDRSHAEDAGWLLGLVHDEVRSATDFVVLDAQSVQRPAIATAHLPWRAHGRARGTWVPTEQTGLRSHHRG